MSKPATLPQPGTVVQLPKLHPQQLAIARSNARFVACFCGRRFGKTTYGVRKCVKHALSEPGVYWWVGPSYPVIKASDAWRTLKLFVIDIPGVEIREADQEVIFPNGSIIAIKSAVDPDSLRGPKLRGVVLDEFSQIKEYAWFEVLRPALADYRGWALFIGTPKGKNWAYRLLERAKSLPGWAGFTIPTAITEDGTAYTKVIRSNNPYLDVKELEDLRQTMTPEQFAQEILADPGVSQYLVFPEVHPDVHEWREKLPPFIGYYGGKDYGGDSIGAHKSTVALAGRTERDELIIFAAFKQSGPNIAERQANWCFEQQSRLEQLAYATHTRYHQPTYWGDKTQSVGIQYARNMGLSIWPTKGGTDSVEAGIEIVHRRLKVRADGKPRLYWYKHGEGCHFVRDDLMKYRYPEPKTIDEVQRKNPLKVDDDLVDAVRYLCEGVDRLVIGDPQEIYSGQIARLR